MGARLKAAREEKGLTLRSLASKISVSSSLLSQIENGKTKPSVDTLYALVRQLDISIDSVLGLAPSAAPAGPEFKSRALFVLQKREDAPVLEMENGVRWERLAVLPGLDIEALRVTYQPGAASSVEGRLMRHLGYEHIAMISGELTLRLGFEEHVIRAGDTMAFASDQPHMFVNLGTEPATGVWYVFGRESRAAGSSAVEVPQERKPGETLNSAIDIMHSFRDS
ncbi:MAG: helix-turn-helix domain-containing protein [Leucobacter sp.]|nr:helix-turn-helix domain-containing protein [Planctomycetota bacterium]MCB1273254.1 helix-turn-helix domain-containing protein [Leucobacter sp.]